MEIALRENSLTDYQDDPPWMFGNSQVVWSSPPREAPAGPPPRPEELDRVVQETMVENLTERVHLQKRVDVVYNGGEPESSESYAVAWRALWAVPLVFAAKGFKLATKPLVGCCTPGRVPPQSLVAGGPQSDPSSGGVAGPLSVSDASKTPAEAAASASPSLPSLSDAAGALAAVLSAAEQPAAAEQTAAAGQPVAAEPAAAAEQPAAPEPPKPEPPGAEAEPAAAPAKAKPEKKKRGGSVVSVSANMQSGVGNLLAGYAGGGSRSRPAKSGGDEKSVIGGPPAPAAPTLPSKSSASSSSSAAPPAASKPSASASASSTAPAAPAAPAATAAPAAPAEEPKKRREGSADSSGERRKKTPGDASASKTVVSNFQSNSAASNLLGPMMAKAGKTRSKRGDSDAKSAIG